MALFSASDYIRLAVVSDSEESQCHFESFFLSAEFVFLSLEVNKVKKNAA